MSEKDNTLKDPLEKRIESLTPEEITKALKVFRKSLDNQHAAYLNSCTHCGLCSDSCHYYLTTEEIQSLPSYKLMLVEKVFKKHFTLLGKRAPGFFGAKGLDKDMIREWVDTLFGRCTLCGRCFLNCSMGLNIPYLIRIARGALASISLIPPELQSTIDTAVEKGNNMGITKDDWVETIEWLEEELQGEVDDPQADIPVDKKGARIFYTINPREPMFFPLSILAVGKIFYSAGENWTLSSENYDMTNYGFFIGDDDISGLLSRRLIESMKNLSAKTLALAECGHGFNSNRWEAPEWLRKKYDFEVRSILQVVAEYIRQGRIKLDPSLNPKPVTLHDPCNLVRLGGIVEEQRYILRHAVSNFIEMTPNREKNFCCGGGGGQLAMDRFVQRRLRAGSVKADQIRKTGAQIVAAPCHNCIDQLMELNKHYKLGVEIKTVCEIVADALVIGKKEKQTS
ncbi:MAG: (Fe-S)-binding protein [Candidatus Aminicenantaceae bacterium]